MNLSLQEINRILSALSRDHDPDDKKLIEQLEIYRYRLTRP
jgi:hypothetical protein